MRIRPLLIIFLAVAAPSSGLAQPVVELYTMGPGEDPFSKFGHAAACVVEGPRSACYNYGTADFRTPIPLSWNFLRGRGLFWVSVTSRQAMIAHYQREDRTLYRQVLPLSDASARGLAARLAHDSREENKYYIYHHFFDNCTTRIRDHIDAVTGGLLRRGAGVPFSMTFRQIVREGFSTSPALLTASELFLGRTLERTPSVWDAMFLPDVLRHEVELRLGAKPEIVYERQAPLPAVARASGQWILVALGVALGLLAGAAFVFGSRRLRRAGLCTAGVALGLVALVIDGLALVSVQSELRHQELLAVFLPTDLALCFLEGRWLRVYLLARVGVLVLVSLLGIARIFVQPLWGPLFFASALLVPLAAWTMRSAKEA